MTIGGTRRKYRRALRPSCASAATAAVVLAATACSSPEEEQHEGGEGTDAGAAATYRADWAEYESVDDLTQQSEYAVLVELGAGEGVWEYPDYSSDDPRVNPYAGTGHTPSDAEIENENLPVTRFPAEVLQMSEGGSPSEKAGTAVNPEGEITVQQPGGTVDGEKFVVEGSEPLGAGDQVLLFVRESPFAPGVFIILGGPGGTFRSADDGGMVSDLGLTLSEPEMQELLESS